jgi:hypothetical protein
LGRSGISIEQVHRGARDAVALKLSEGGALPTEIRIWKVGVNTDRNGYNVLWDAKAAKQVMDDYAAHGVRLTWDLEHMSLDDEAPNYDPDARAHCDLELRDGELWATNIQWTPDGAERLTSGKQRYPSPAFRTDKDGRPTRVVNIALCARPATDHIEPLAAKDTGMKLNLSKALAAGLRVRSLNKGGLPASAIIKTLADGAPGGDATGTVAGIDIASLADFLGVDIDPAQDPVGFVKAILAKLDEIEGKLGGDSTPDAPADAAAPADKSDTPPAEMAAAKLMIRLMGVDTFDAGVLKMNEWRGIVTSHEAAAKKVADDRAAIETTERTALVVRLQKCGAETPATSGLSEGKLVKRLADEPLDAMRARVSQIELAKNTQSGATLSPMVGGTPNTDGAVFVIEGKSVSVTAEELQICSESKCDPQVFAMLKGRRQPAATV